MTLSGSTRVVGRKTESSKPNQPITQTHGHSNRMVVIGGKVDEKKMKRVKGVKYMVMEGDQTFGGAHTMQYTSGIL